ncbi:MAG: MATE family efflux transporter [Halioglobus sp.]
MLERLSCVRLAFSCGAGVTLLVGFFCMLALLAAPGFIISLYTDDTTIYGIAMALIQLASFFILIDATQITATFTLRAFKDTMFPFVVLCSAYWFITLPLGCWLGLVVADNALDGAVNFWKAMILGVALSCVVLVWRLVRTLKRPLPEVSGESVTEM